MRTLRPLFVLLLSAALAVAGGCVKKSFGVRTEPPGATVYLDGLELGKTPIDYVPFDFYGTREIVLHKPGYLSERRIVEIEQPWYSYFPVDIVSELVIPWDIPDRRRYFFPMKPAELIEDSALMRHAHETREVAKSRIEGARLAAKYKPRAYVIKGEKRKSIFLGLFTSTPRSEPLYTVPEKPPEEPEESE